MVRIRDQVRVVAKDFCHKRGVKLVPGFEVPVVDHKRFDVGLGRTFQGKGTGLIAADGNDLSGEIPLTTGINQCLEVGAAARRKHQDFRQRSLICLHADSSPGA